MCLIHEVQVSITRQYKPANAPATVLATSEATGSSFLQVVTVGTVGLRLHNLQKFSEG